MAASHSNRGLWIAIALSLAASLTPWGELLLYPFKLFTTWIHECSHALVTVLVGGSVRSISLQPDTSGLTRSLVPVSRVAGGLVASAGYLGASLVGCLLVAATRAPRRARFILSCVAVFMVLTLVLWMRNLFGFAVVSAWAVVLVLLVRNSTNSALRFLLTLLAVQVALNAVYDIRVLFQIDRGPSDAATMARLFLLPPWIWAASWMAISAAMLWATLSATRGRS